MNILRQIIDDALDDLHNETGCGVILDHIDHDQDVVFVNLADDYSNEYQMALKLGNTGKGDFLEIAVLDPGFTMDLSDANEWLFHEAASRLAKERAKAT